MGVRGKVLHRVNIAGREEVVGPAAGATGNQSTAGGDAHIFADFRLAVGISEVVFKVPHAVLVEVIELADGDYRR